MIVKKIPARPAGRDAITERATHARHLIDYIRLPEKESAEKAYMVAYMLGAKLGDTSAERLFHIGTRGFVSTTLEGQRAEMIAVAQQASRSPNPVDHWLLSWREGELPTPEQVDEAVAMFVNHLGVGAQPCIYACHGDTHNRHVHIALNRYDPLARRMIEINDGWTLEAAHQAVALIVDQFGWQAEADARYEVVDGSPVLTAAAKARVEEGREAIRPKAAAFENRTGFRSAQRIAQDEALLIIKAARSWDELHTSLADIGITYDASGRNGVTIGVGEDRVKASIVDRAITRTRMEERLGPFQPRDPTLRIRNRDSARDRLPEAFRADEYRAECERWREWRDEKRRDRATPAETEPHGEYGERVGAAALEHDASPLQAPRRHPPDLESWYYARQEGEFAKRWRNRRQSAQFFALSGEEREDAELPVDVDGYLPFACSDGVRYARGPDEPTAFIDRGRRIDVVLSDDAALLAALKLAAVKFEGGVSVHGSTEFRERIYALAKANGLEAALNDPEFVARRAAEQRARSKPECSSATVGAGTTSKDAERLRASARDSRTGVRVPIVNPGRRKEGASSDARSSAAIEAHEPPGAVGEIPLSPSSVAAHQGRRQKPVPISAWDERLAREADDYAPPQPTPSHAAVQGDRDRDPRVPQVETPKRDPEAKPRFKGSLGRGPAASKRAPPHERGERER